MKILRLILLTLVTVSLFKQCMAREEKSKRVDMAPELQMGHVTEMV